MFYGQSAINKAEGQTINKKTKTCSTRQYFPDYIKISYISTRKKKKDEHYGRNNGQKHE